MKRSGYLHPEVKITKVVFSPVGENNNVVFAPGGVINQNGNHSKPPYALLLVMIWRFRDQQLLPFAISKVC